MPRIRDPVEIKDDQVIVKAKVCAMILALLSGQ